MKPALLVLALLGACAPAPQCSPPLPAPPLPPVAQEPVAAPPPLLAAPATLRAELIRVAPREAALVASDAADADAIALVRQLHRNVEHALADLERDGGRHITPAAVKRAQTAVKDLQNHLNEFQASQPEGAP